MHRRSNFVLISLALFSVASLPSIAQVAGGNQQIFQDEQQILRMDSNQVQQYQQQDQMLRSDVAQETSQPYRLYAQQRIKELQKIKSAHGSPALSTAREKQLYALQSWLAQDKATIQQQQARIKQLDQAIANLQQQRNATTSDLSSDINAMRENQEQLAEDDRFNKMMRINQFNELQSEMGNASWGGSPTDGTWNAVGGRYGFGGGYGYSYGGGRRW